MNFEHTFQEVFSKVESEHVGSVGFGRSGVGMCLHEDAVATHGNSGTTDGLYHLGIATGDACCLVGALERMGDVDDYRHLVALHGGNASEIDHEVLIAEGGASLGEHDVTVTEMGHLVDSMNHGLGREELSFLDVDTTACGGSGFEQGGLPTQKCGYLEYVDILGGHGGLLFGVNVGDHGDAVFLAYGAENFKTGLVADASKGVDTGTVGFTIGGFEGVGQVEPLGDGHEAFGDKERTCFVLYNTRTGNQKEIAGLCKMQI